MQERKERRDYQENRRIILQSALELFDVHGIDNVSMRQIAQSAGIGQGTLYRRYAHKGELCLDIMKERMHRIGEEIQSYLYESRDQTIHHKLDKIVEIMLDFVEKQSQNLSAIKAPGCEQNSIIYSTPIYKSIHAIICELLKEALREQGRSTPDPIYTADAILAMLSPQLYVYQRIDRGYSINEIRENISSLFFDPLFATIQ
ncbi:MAG: TetR/AcrR family transcriptional regulator [Paenibacillaceae bacterium]